MLGLVDACEVRGLGVRVRVRVGYITILQLILNLITLEELRS
jgi:hypothetical protein